MFLKISDYLNWPDLWFAKKAICYFIEAVNYKARLQLSINSLRKFNPNYIGVHTCFIGNYERSVIWTF